MKLRHLGQAAFLAVFLAVAIPAGAYLAGYLFYLINKTMPHDIHLDTWWRYWHAYSEHPVQGKRLLITGIAAPAITIALPLVFHFAHRRRPRPLHGDARWATTAEIRLAGLL